MPFQMNLWEIKGNSLSEIYKSKLDAETRLESWLEKDPTLLGIELLIIGRQVSTVNGGRIDLLSIDRQGDLFIIELKRDRTPRDVIAQVLDYASWVRTLDYEAINNITYNHRKESLPDAFRGYFNEPLPENINTAHSMVIVASEFDESSERIVQYLADEYKVDINVVFFTYFQYEQNELIGRAWLRDPELVQQVAKTRKRSPWSGYWFVNVGEDTHRNWDDNRKYGYIGAGQGSRYSRALKRLKAGDKIFAYMKGRGYVGFGEVTQEAVTVKEFVVENEGKSLLDLPLQATQAGENADNSEQSEWAVGVNWLKTFARSDAKTFKGIFANQNIVCEIRQPETVDFLEREFDIAST